MPYTKSFSYKLMKIYKLLFHQISKKAVSVSLVFIQFICFFHCASNAMEIEEDLFNNDRIEWVKKCAAKYWLPHRLINDDGTIVDNNTPANVLSIDGGGVRGVVASMILEKIEDKMTIRDRRRAIKQPGQQSAQAYQLFDLVAGTSTGALLAMGLTKSNNPLTATQMTREYETISPTIFPSGVISNLESWMGLGLISGYKYSPAPLERESKRIFQDERLSDLRLPAIITSVDAITRREKLFRSHRTGREGNMDVLLRDVARATSAAPTYFPAAHIPTDDNHPGRKSILVDGGLASNNPSLNALFEAWKLFGERPINLISIGTGTTRGNYHNDPGWQTYGGKASLIIDILMETQSAATESIIDHFRDFAQTRVTHCRIQPPIPSDISQLDDSKKVPNLERVVENWIEIEGRNKIAEAINLIRD